MLVHYLLQSTLSYRLRMDLSMRHSSHTTSLTSPMSATTYDPHSGSGLARIPAVYASSSSCNTVLSTSNMFHVQSSDFSSVSSDNQSAGSDNSPYCSDTPSSPPDFSVEDSSLITDPHNSHFGTGCYSSSSRYPGPSSILSGSHSPPPPSRSPSPFLAGPAPSTMLPMPLYSSHDYSSATAPFANFFSSGRSLPLTFSTLPSSFSGAAIPSLNAPMWSPYPSLPSVGLLPTNKLSYDSPRYKLTPERAIPLIKWFEEHKEHPYPTRHEKILLCQSTQLTFTQVSTWFANARRRIRKASSSEEEDSITTQGSKSSSVKENSPDSNNSRS